MASHATHRAQAKSLHSKGLITDKQHAALIAKIEKAEQAEEASEASQVPDPSAVGASQPTDPSVAGPSSAPDPSATAATPSGPDLDQVASGAPRQLKR